jgi:hypothetical protein
MDKVYIVFAGEQYASHNLVSVHATDAAALAAAKSYMENDEDIASHEYKVDRGGHSWTSKSGHYVTIATHRVA